MNFLFKTLFKNTISPEDEADSLVKTVTGSVFVVFKDQDFRERYDFDKYNQTDKDRVFNELAVTGLVLLLSIIEDNISRIKTERQEFWQKVSKQISDAFSNWLSGLNVPQNFVKVWKQLIDLRFNEFNENKVQTRRLWVEDFLKNNNEKLSDAIIRVETLTVSGSMHLTRGKSKPDDSLHKYMRTWLSILSSKMEKKIGW